VNVTALLHLYRAHKLSAILINIKATLLMQFGGACFSLVKAKFEAENAGENYSLLWVVLVQ
jgi:hypothetical protein